jgi:hypothetical protein
MSADGITRIAPAISSALAEETEVRLIDEHEAQIYVPFYFPDGDGLVVYVREVGGGRLELTDKAHTIMHLSYHIDVDRLREGTRSAVLERIWQRHGIEDREGELVSATDEQHVGQAVLSFVQALLETSDIRMLEREVVRSTFREDLERLLVERFPQVQRNYIDGQHDPAGTYPVPYLLNGTDRPLALFDVATDDAVARAIVIADRHREWRPTMVMIAVEQDQERLGRRSVAWLSDAFDKQFSRLAGNEDALVEYVEREQEIARRLEILRRHNR